MKTTEEYLDDYLDKYNDLKRKDELWRLRVSPQEFLLEIERIREYGVKLRQSNYFTEYHIQCNEKEQIVVMLMNRVTSDEFIAQVKRIRESAAYFEGDE